MNETDTRIQVIPFGQYVKSKGFEMYKKRQELAALTAKPETEFELATVKEKLANNNYEVGLQIEVVAKTDETSNIFKATLNYVGEFKIIGDASEEVIEEVLLVNCLTLLFPFARQIVAELCLNAGSVVMLDPIDFRNNFLAYKKRQAEEVQSKVANTN